MGNLLNAMARACAVLLGLVAAHAQAARPLTTDDASVNPARLCQLEAWVERSDAGRTGVLAPACGLGAGFELGAGLSQGAPGDRLPDGRGLTLKWADPRVRLGGWQLGARFDVAWERAPGAAFGDDGRSHAATLLASRDLGSQLALHLNLGHLAHEAAPRRATGYAVALAWTPAAPLLLYAEVSGDDRSPPVRGAGLRWWLRPDTLGLDLTWSRQAATPDARVWTLGVGWYGIGI